MKIIVMVINWWVIGFVIFFVVIGIVYLIWKNIKDEKGVTKTFFNDEMKPEKHEINEEEI